MTPWDLVLWFLATALGIVLLALAASLGIGVIRAVLGYRDEAAPDTPDNPG